VDEKDVAVVAVTTLFGAFLSMLGWHSRVQGNYVDDLRDRTARLEATAVKADDIRRIIREEINPRNERIDGRLEKHGTKLDEMVLTIHQIQLSIEKRSDYFRKQMEKG
jgi:hypothetical protein